MALLESKFPPKDEVLLLRLNNYHILRERKHETPQNAEVEAEIANRKTMLNNEQTPSVTSFNQTIPDFHDNFENNDDVCTKYIAMANVDIIKHPYFKYPAVKVAGISKALLEGPIPEPYKDSKEEYLSLCNDMDIVPIKQFIEDLSKEKIDLKYYGVNPHGMKAICTVLFHNTTVTYMDLTDNWLTKDACFHLRELLEKNTTLQYLNLTKCQIGSEGMRHLAEGVKSSTSIKEVMLPHNNLQDEGMEHLAQAIAVSPMQKYDLRYNKIKNLGAQKLAEGLQNNSTITHLDLSWNFIESDNGMNHILKAITNIPTLIWLDISWNGLLGSEIAQPLRRLLSLSPLQYLDISHNLLSGAGLVNVSNIFFKTKTLKTMKIGFNHISPTQAVSILQNFSKKSVTIETLDLGDTCVLPEFLKVLNKLKSNKLRTTTVVYGNVIEDFTIVGPDYKEILMKRAKYLGDKKKKRMSFGQFILELNTHENLPTIDEFMALLKTNKFPLDKDLKQDLCNNFLITQKKIDYIDIKEMAVYIKKLWPDVTLDTLKPKAAKKEKKKGKTASKKKKK